MGQEVEVASSAASTVTGLAVKAGAGASALAGVVGAADAWLPIWMQWGGAILIAMQITGWLWDRFYIRRREAKQLLCDITGKGCDDGCQ